MIPTQDESLTIEADILRAPTPVKDLQWDFSRELIRPRKSHHGENTLGDLSLHRGVERDSRSKNQDVDPETSVAESVLDLEDEIAREPRLAPVQAYMRLGTYRSTSSSTRTCTSGTSLGARRGTGKSASPS